MRKGIYNSNAQYKKFRMKTFTTPKMNPIMYNNSAKPGYYT